MEPVALGDLTPRERSEVDRAIRQAELTSRFEFSVFIGTAEGEPAGYARRLHSSLVAPQRSVLVMVDPTARAIEVVTGAEVRRHLTDAEVELAIISMQSAFAEGDHVGGLTGAVLMLADHARPQRTLHAQP